jgi:phosphohistidine phosphatase SixA
VLTDYSALEASQRNILRLVFCSPQVRAAQTDWETIARFVVAAFRADVVRAGTPQSALTLIEDLRRLSPEFEALWLNHDVRTHGEGTKLVRDMGGKLIEF